MKGYKSLKIPIMDQKGVPAWPEMFPPKRIDGLRGMVGARHFASQMMLEPIQPDKARLDSNALHFYNYEFDMKSARLGETLITGWAFYWDPSAAHKRNDASVCVLLLRDDRNRRAYIHDCIYLEADEFDPHPLATQCGAVLDFMQNFGLGHIAIEVNGLGNALPEILRREAALREQQANVVKVVNSENKAKRILDAVEPFLSTGRLYAHEKIKETKLIDEMGDWTPNGWTHDDGLDALAGALRLQPIPLRPRNTAIRALHAKTDFNV